MTKSEQQKKYYRFKAMPGGLTCEGYTQESLDIIAGRMRLVPDLGGEPVSVDTRWLEKPRAAELWTKDSDPNKAYARLLASAERDAENARGRLAVYDRLLGQIQSAGAPAAHAAAKPEKTGANGLLPPHAELAIKSGDVTRTFGLAALADALGLDRASITHMSLRLRRGGMVLHADIEPKEADYPGIDVDACTDQAGDVYLGNFELPCETYPQRIAARLYAGCHKYETDEPIAIVTHEVTDDARVLYRSDRYSRDTTPGMKKLIYVDYKEAETRPWLDATEEGMPEHLEDEENNAARKAKR